MNQQAATNVTTGQVRLSYVHLFRPHANKQGQEAKYSVTILIPKSDYATKQRIDTAIQAAIEKGVTSVWKGARPPQPQMPVWDGDGLRKNGEPFGDECKGHWVITASSKQKQAIVDANMNPIIDETQVYSGMYGRVNINFFPFDNSGNRGIGAGLGPVQKLADGEPLGGRISAEQAFGAAQPTAPPAAAYGQAPGYGAPAAYPLQPGYGQAPQPGYGVPPQPPAPGYGQAAGYGAPPAYPPQPAPQVDPITGKPLSGGIYGV